MDKIYILNILLISTAVLIGLWIATWPAHIKKNPHKMLTKNILFRLSLLFILLPLTIFTAIQFPFPVGNLQTVITLLGIGIYGIGYILAVWAKLSMKDSWGGPAQHDIQGQNKLITSGPFAYSRNPIYLSLLLLFFGFTFAVQSPAIIFVVVYYFVFLNFIKKEEALLDKYFGKEYIEYKKKVGRFI